MTGTPIAEPIAASIEKSGLAVGIEDWLDVPATDAAAPLARINILRGAPDGRDRLFVNDLRGALWQIDGNVITEFADMSELFANFLDDLGLGTGFSSFAFHPEFASNGKFYTHHTEVLSAGTPDFPVVNGFCRPTVLQGVVTEWTMSDPAAQTWAGSHREVMRVDFPGHFHSMQEINFNPTASPGDADYGLLYIGIGDGGQFKTGTGGDAAHRLDSVLGTILRIDPLGSNAGNGRYGIPTDNPFVADGDPNTLGEIYAWGFRNPHRFTWDPVTGKAIVGEIGQDNIEELNLLAPGADYGWYHREGIWAVDPVDASLIYDLPADDATNGYTYPVAMYDHDEGIAIAGGHVYRGSAIPSLQGQYIFSDIVTGRMFHVPVDDLVQGQQATLYELTLKNRGGNTVRLKQLVGSNRADVRFGLDAEGEITILTKTDGKIRKLFDLGQSDVISVSSGDDLVNATDADNQINALGGNDIVRTGSGNDTIWGRAGNDTLEARAGDDRVLGAGGEDSLRGGRGFDTINGGNGRDVIDGGKDADRLAGGLGQDTILGGDGDDWATGGNAADLIEGGLGDDTLLGQGAEDSLDGGDGNDSLSGGAGADMLVGGAGNDTADGGAFNDLVDGGAGADSLIGGTGRDTLLGGDGDDVLRGGSSADVLDGGFGNDLLDADIGADILSGGDGADTLLGGAANDDLAGGAGADVVDGGTGSDRLTVGAGEGGDTLTGGAGPDVFVFTAGFGSAEITDFLAGQDRLDLSGMASVTGLGDIAISYAADATLYLGGDMLLLTGVTGGLVAADFLF